MSRYTANSKYREEQKWRCRERARQSDAWIRYITRAGPHMVARNAKLPPDEKAKRMLVQAARSRAQRRQMDFDLDVTRIHWPTHCPVFETAFNYGAPHKKGEGPSLDRLDNSKGYTLDNIAVISLRANTLKNNATADELEKVLVYCRNGIW